MLARLRGRDDKGSCHLGTLMEMMVVVAMIDVWGDGVGY